MPKPTKRYWVDWETASTKVEDGWSIEQQDEPTNQRVTQREFVRQKEAAQEPGLTPGAPPPPPRGNAGLEERRTAPRRRQMPLSDPAPEAKRAPAPPAKRAPARPAKRSPDPPPRRSPDPPAAAPSPTAQPASPPSARASSQPVDEVDPAATVGRLPRQMESSSAGEASEAMSSTGDSGGRGQAAGQDEAMVPVNAPPTIAVATHNFLPEFARDPRLVLVREPDSEQAAAYRVLRHHVVQQGNPHVIVVSSAKQGERKTTCAVNLALALSECRRARVLLADANLRRPQLAAIFRFQPPKCFAEQLLEHRDRPMEEWSVVEIAPHGLHVAAASPRPDPLLDAPAFAFAMERLRMAGYDHIVVDAPPVLGSAEVNLLQDAADGVLLTSLAGRSRRRDLRAVVEQLSPASILGVVLLKE